MWLEINKKNDYEADPFIFAMNGMAYIAFEKFRYTHGNAKIHCVDINGKEYGFFSEINKIKGHKSFPYIFHDGNNVYCIPETSDLNAILLYKFNNEKAKFILERKLLLNGEFIDSFVYKHNEVYYLFTSRVATPYRLELYTAISLYEEFKKHTSSPITDDACHGRNAGGIIKENDSLYRVAQNCSKTYGGSISIRKIEKLAPDCYQEVSFTEIEPLRPYSKGIHTLSYITNMVVIDGKCERFSMKNLFRKIIYKYLKKNGIEINF